MSAGFSIVKYTGNGIAGSTIGHGLSSAPEFTIIKKLDTVGYSGGNWVVGYGSYNTDLYLNTNGAAGTINYFWNSAPTPTVLELKNDWFVNYSGAGYIIYNFHSVAGYSKIGSYEGNAGTQTIYTTDDGTSTGSGGFEPSFVMMKNIEDTTNSHWLILDSARSTTNPREDEIYANLSLAEQDLNRSVNFVSNGFELTSTTYTNRSGIDYIFMAFK